TAKKSEAAKKELKGAVDYVLTFEEIMALFEAFDIDLAKCSNEDIDDASIFGRGFGAAGGLTKAIENYLAEKGIGVNFEPVKISGSREIKKTMTMANLGKLEGNFIEGMMCEGGCINGSGKFLSGAKVKATFDRKNSQSTKKSVLANTKIKDFSNINLEK
ncbi:TPA: [Fe-Fe] hydrogenase large subunit C-terminal domain-containing protein, partial [Clostridioides difficile]